MDSAHEEKMPPIRRLVVDVGIGRGRPVENTMFLQEVIHLHARMEAMETTQRREPGIGDVNEAKESLGEEEIEEETT
jgi:hypothetical protein